MLYLTLHNKQIKDLYPELLMRFETDITSYGSHEHHWVSNDITNGLRQKNISYAALPYFLHDITISNKTFLFAKRIRHYNDLPENDTNEWREEQTAANITEVLRTFKNNILSIPDKEKLTKDIIYIKCYAPHDHYEQVLNGINEALEDTDIKPVEGTISSLYNKTLQDVLDRYNYTTTMHANEWVSKERHVVITLTNIDDYDNASDTFLSLGLFPVFFDDIQQLMTDKELNYCKELVHRSQVKRINNKDIAIKFSEIDINTWLKEQQDHIYKLVIDQITVGRKRGLEQELIRYSETVDRALINYTNALRDYKNREEDIKRLTENTESLKDDLELAFSTEGVNLMSYDNFNQMISEIVEGALTFYEQDELEILLSGSFTTYYNPDFIKQFLTDIFIDKKYKLHCGVHTLFPLNRSNASLRLNKESGSFYRENNLFPNPHLQFYTCTGDYKPKLVQAIMNADILMYNNILLASVKTYNFRDSTVFSQFCHTLDSISNVAKEPDNFNYGELESNIIDSKCLEDEEGNRISIRDAYFYKEPVDIEVEDTL